MNTEAPLDICCNHGEQIVGRLDRAIQVLEEIRDARTAKPRGYTLADQFNDLIQRHGKGTITDAKFYEILAEITSIRHPDAKATGGVVGGCQNDQSHLHGTSCVMQAAQRPDNGIQVHIDPHHVIGATIHELKRQGRLRE